jgi:molybdopterin molybdotransferase
LTALQRITTIARVGESPQFLDVPEAQRLVLSAIPPGQTVELSLAEALGRTLAVDITADIDDPPFDRAVMDGYAVRSEDVGAAPFELAVVGQIAAGHDWGGVLRSGQAAQINTGAALPAGADAVMQVERTTLLAGGARVRIEAPGAPGLNVTRRGTHVRTGATVLTAGTRLGPPQMAVAAAVGAAHMRVYRPATVAILSTGDELVDVNQTPGPTQIRNSNGYLLVALCRQAGALPVSLGIARDEPGVLEARIRDGLAHDILLITGGISMGAHDLVPEALRRCGVTVQFRKLAIRPGKPTLFGIADCGLRMADSQNGPTQHAYPAKAVKACHPLPAPRCAVFALPGNPVSAFVAFWLLVRPALAAREGRADAIPPLFAARLEGALKPTADRRSFIPARLAPDSEGQLVATPTPWHGSGDPFGLARANALIMRAPHAAGVQSGESVQIMMLDG